RAVEEGDRIAFFAEGYFQDARGIFDYAEDADHRRGIDRVPERLVVKAYVTAGDGRAEFVAGDCQAVDRFAELPHHFGFFRAAEVEAIRRGDRACAAARDVARGFRYRVHCAQTRI